MSIILGIDTGSRVCGFGVIEVEGNSLRHRECGIFKMPDRFELPARLAMLARDIMELLGEAKPDLSVVERPFVNPKFGGNGAISVGAAYGVALCCCGQVSPVLEVGPTEVKKWMGHGRSNKSQVGAVVQRLLGLDATPQPLDAADALAIALTGHAITTRGSHEADRDRDNDRPAVKPRPWSRSRRYPARRSRGLFGA